MAEKILDVQDLTISFKTDNGLVRAVRGVSFDLSKGENEVTLGELFTAIDDVEIVSEDVVVTVSLQTEQTASSIPSCPHVSS